MIRTLRAALMVALSSLLCVGQSAAGPKVHSLEIRILSTMLTSETGIGEWGFAALVVADGHSILFDTGARPETVLRNSRDLKIDLSNVPDVILSHFHPDHTGGLLTLRSEFSKTNPAALGRVHAANGIFRMRYRDGAPYDRMAAVKREYEATGATVNEYNEPTELFPGIWLTGPVLRKYPEHNWSGNVRVKAADGTFEEDTILDDQALVIDTDKGLVIVTGCGHAGAVNICDYARARVRNAPVHALVGGLHLVDATDETVDWTAGKLKGFGLQNLLGAHCTGIEPLYRLRQGTGLNRKTAAVGAAGSGFTLAGGIDSAAIAK